LSHIGQFSFPSASWCRVQGSGFRVQGSGFRVQGSGCRVQGSGCRVQGSGFRVQGSGCTLVGNDLWPLRKREPHAEQSVRGPAGPGHFPPEPCSSTCESGPLRAVHWSRHKWPGGVSQLGFLLHGPGEVQRLLSSQPKWSNDSHSAPFRATKFETMLTNLRILKYSRWAGPGHFPPEPCSST